MAVPVRLSSGLSEHKACSHSGWDTPQTGMGKAYRKSWSLSHDEQFSVCGHQTHQRVGTFNHEYIHTWFFSSLLNVAGSIPESPC